MSYFDDKSTDEDERRNHAFQTVCAAREAVTLAKKTKLPITYEEAFGFIKQGNPSMFEGMEHLLRWRNNNEIARRFEEKAVILNAKGEKTDAISLLLEELKEQRKIVADKENEEARSTEAYIKQIKSAIDYFKVVPIDENTSLMRDYSLAKRLDVDTVLYDGNDQYTDYKLPDQNVLRLRFLHPGKDEHVVGADLIYEIHDLEGGKCRFVHLQYKMWDSEKFYFSQSGNLKGQLTKLEDNLCKSGYCHNEYGQKVDGSFRLPFCCGFLRPTNRIQTSDSKLVTMGMHVPVCVVQGIRNANGVKLTKKGILSNSISHLSFGEAFTANTLGSRWMTTMEMQTFYKEKGLLDHHDIIRVHAIEYQIGKAVAEKEGEFQ